MKTHLGRLEAFDALLEARQEPLSHRHGVAIPKAPPIETPKIERPSDREGQRLPKTPPPLREAGPAAGSGRVLRFRR